MRALVIQHEDDTPAGYVNEWLEGRGIELDLVWIKSDERELDPASYDLVVALGSEHGAYEDIPWIHREEALLRDAHEREVPTLAICFGSQLLAKALGGEAFRRREPEIGWLPLRTRDDALVPEGPWLVWHFDSFTVPPGARLIADTPDAPQAYTAGRSLGLQFHPEVTFEIVEDWVRSSSDELVKAGVDTRGLLDRTRERAAEAREQALRIFDAFLDRVSVSRAR